MLREITGEAIFGQVNKNCYTNGICGTMDRYPRQILDPTNLRAEFAKHQSEALTSGDIGHAKRCCRRWRKATSKKLAPTSEPCRLQNIPKLFGPGMAKFINSSDTSIRANKCCHHPSPRRLLETRECGD